MKAIFSALFFTLSVITSFAQTKSDSMHLSFKGVPINGTLNEFVSMMEQSGLTAEPTENGMAVLKGDFASYKNCIVGVSTLKQKDLVSKITVRFPSRDTWSSLSFNYSHLKELLAEKYGKPSTCVESFQTYSQPKDDESKMFEAKSDNCKYYTIYKTEKGTIQLSVEHDDVRRCFVKLIYTDKINSETIKKEALDDL